MLKTKNAVIFFCSSFNPNINISEILDFSAHHHLYFDRLLRSHCHSSTNCYQMMTMSAWNERMADFGHLSCLWKKSKHFQSKKAKNVEVKILPASASTSPALNIFAAKQNKEGNEHQQHIIVNCQDGFVRSDFIPIPVTLFVSDLDGHFWCRNRK